MVKPEHSLWYLQMAMRQARLLTENIRALERAGPQAMVPYAPNGYGQTIMLGRSNSLQVNDKGEAVSGGLWGWKNAKIKQGFSLTADVIKRFQSQRQPQQQQRYAAPPSPYNGQQYQRPHPQGPPAPQYGYAQQNGNWAPNSRVLPQS
jgi:hypothetical protein